MKTNLLSNAIKLMLVLLFATIKMQAANVTWLAAVPGNWNDGTKWSGGAAPGVNDTAVITIAGTYTVTLNVSPTIAKVVLGNASGYQTLNLNGQTLTLANNSIINPHGILDFQNYSTLSGAGTLTNNGKILLNLYGTMSANVNNNDSIVIDHYGNTFTGTYTNTATSTLYFRCANNSGQLTFSTGWTNNGKILLAGPYYYSNLFVTAGVLVNAAGAEIKSLSNAYTYNRIDAAVNNQGTMNLDGSLRIYTSTAASTNTGTVNYTSPNAILTYYSGTVNWNGAALNFNTGCSLDLSSATLNWNSGTTTGSGQFNFESSTANFNTGTMPAQPTYFNYSTLGSSLGSISNSKRITLNLYSTISANLNNTDSIIIDHYGNTFTGTYTNTAASVLYFRCANNSGQITFSTGWTNNGKILLAGPYYYSNLLITTGVLVNPIGSEIKSLNNAYTYNRIDAAVNNQGTINIVGNLRIYTSSAASTNTGSVNFTTPNNTLTYYSGIVNWNGGTLNFNTDGTLAFSSATLNWNGGAQTGTGLFSFESSTGNFNTATMPAQPMYFNYSTLGSSLGSISNSKRITLNLYSTISANLNNTDSIIIDHYGNTFTGTYTNTATSVLYFRCANNSGQITYSTGWTNNGKILLAGPYYYSNLLITTGVLVNPIGSEIKSLNNAYTYNRIDAAVNNQGTMNIDGNLRIYNSATPSENTGIVNFTTPSNTLTYYNGTVNWNSGALNFNTNGTLAFNSATLNWNGGTITGTGLFSFESSTGNFNTATMPAQPMYFNYSTLGSSLGSISNSKRITLNLYSTISANLNNTDSIIIDHYGNTCTGTYTNTATSVLYFRCANNSGQITFSTGWTNNGKILLAGPYYYSNLFITTGVLVNPIGSEIKSLNNAYAYNRIDGAVNNQGIMNIDGNLRIYTSAAASTNTGTVNFTTPNNSLTYYNGIVNWNNAALNFNTDGTLAFNSATLNWNGAPLTGNGLITFETSTANINTAATPNVRMYFNNSTLASPQLPLLSSHFIQFNYNNSITAAIFNTDTIRVSHYNNIMSGALTTSTASLISIDGSNYHSDFSTTSGFTNNGTIDLRSVNGYNSALGINSGVMINAATGIIHSYAGAYATTRTITGGVNNIGTITIDLSLIHNNNSATSTNTGAITIASGQTYTLNNGTYNYNGGSATGLGKWYFNGVTINYNVAAFPPVFEMYDNSTINSSVNPIANNNTLQINASNTIGANILNNNLIRVSHYNNFVNGNMTSVAASVLSVEGSNYHSDITFNADFTNNGLVELRSVSGYNAALNMAATKIFTNTANGIFKSWLGIYNTGRNISGAFVNHGNFIVDLSLIHNNASDTSLNTGTITIATGQTYTVNNGTYDFNGGTATGNGKWYFNGVTVNYNVSAFPTVFELFDNSIINSSFNPIANNNTLQFNVSNTIGANVLNNDTIRISHYNNFMNGIMTSVATSILSVEGSNYHSDITFNTDFTNNGLVELRSVSGYNSALNMAATKTFTNTSGGIFKSWLGIYNTGRNISGAFVNNGNFIVDLSLIHANASDTSINTGTITIANGQTYTLNNGTYNFNGGTASGNGKWFFNGVTANYNVAAFPSVYEVYDNSIINSPSTPILNNNVLQWNYNNTVNASVQNNDSVLVSHYGTVVHGNFIAPLNSTLSVNGLNYHSDVRFDNAFTNHGIVELISISGYNSSLYFTNGTFINETDGVFRSGGIYNVTHLLEAPSFENKGQMSNEFNLRFNMTAAAKKYYNKPSGIFKAKGSINHDLNTSFVNEGSFQPGASPGQVDFYHYSTDSIHFTPTANLNIEIGGYNVGSQYDKMTYNGQHNLNGALNLSLINGFMPVLGDSFIIATFASKTGTFATVTGQNIGGGLFWNVFYRPTYVVIRAGNPPNLNITSSAGTNGTISPLGVTSVTYNGTQAFTISANTNYHIQDVLVDGNSIGAVSNYTFNTVINNRTIHATFAINTHTIVASSSGNGTISPSGTLVVNQGTNHLYTITPNPCNLIDSVIVDGSYVGTPSTYPFTNVIANHTIKAVFRIAPRITANGPTTFCAGGSVTLDAGAGYSNYEWSNGASTQSTTITTSGTYTCTITSTGGCTSSTAVAVTVNPLPNVAFAPMFPSDNNHTCVTDGGINLSTSGLGTPVGGGYGGAGVYCYIQCGFTPSVATVGSHAITYYYTDANGCSNTASQTVIVDQNATVNAGTNIILCNNLVAALNGTANATAGQITWTSNGTGVFSNDHSLTSTYTLSSADSALGSVLLTLTSANPTGPCGIVSSQVLITYNPDAVANAGAPISCVNVPVAVSGSITGYPANPYWTTTGTGSFTNANLLATTYNPSLADLAATHVKLILTPVDPNGNCTFTADTIEVWFNPNYVVNAGNDVVLCGINDTIATINGSFSVASSVTWTSSGSGTFANANAANTTYTLSPSDRANGYIYLTLTSNDPTGPCNAVSDYMILKYKYAIADAGQYQICSDTVTSLAVAVNTNSYSLSSLGYQWTTAGTGNFSSPNLYYTNYTASNADIALGKIKVYIQPIDGANECTYAKDSVEIWFNPHYAVDAGPDSAEVCSNEVLTLSGTKVNALSTTWSSSGNGIITNPNSLNATYTPSSADSLAGYVKIYFTSNNPNGPCNEVVDSLYVTVLPEPDASAGSNSPICAGTDLNLTASNGTSYLWSGPNAYNSILQNIVIPNATTNLSGTYNVIVTNSFGCSNPASTIVIVNPCGCIAPTLLEGHNDASCFGGHDGSVNLTTVGGSGGNTFLWSNGATTEDINNVIAGIYTVTVTATGGCQSTKTIVINDGAPLSPITITKSGSTLLCGNNSNITLNAGAGWSTYNWSNGLHTQSITVSTTGNYYVNLINANGCVAKSDTVAVIKSASAPATVAKVYAPEAVCLGSSYTYYVRTTARAQNYNWVTPPGVLINGNPSPYLTPDTAVTLTFTILPQTSGFTGFTVCVNAVNACGSGNSKCQFTRYHTSLPNPIAGAVDVCANNTYTYSTKSVAGAYLYKWKSPTGTLINGQPSPYTSADTAVSVTFTNAFVSGSVCVSSSALGCVYSDERCVSIRSTPITPSGVTGLKTGVCSSTKTYACNTMSGATGYKWIAPPGVLINGLASPQTTVIPSANFTFPNNYNSGNICVQTINACNVLSASACYGPIIGKPAKPTGVTGPLTACANQANVLYNATLVTGATTYAWTVPVGATFTGQNNPGISVHFATGGGSITVKAANTCGISAATLLNVNINCREGELLSDEIKVYPNPAHDKLFISIASMQSENYQIELFDAIGKIVQSSTSDNHETMLDVSAFGQGIYFLKITNGEQQVIKRVVVE